MARTFFAAVATLITLLVSASSFAVVPPITQPAWAQLSADQKQVLAPLADEWDAMENLRRKKWLGIAERYAKQTPAEQVRVQERMREWARLSAEERKAARAKFKSVSNASPERKEVLKQKWQEYSGLPDEEKARLKEEAARKSVPRSPPPGRPLAPASTGTTPAVTGR